MCEQLSNQSDASESKLRYCEKNRIQSWGRSYPRSSIHRQFTSRPLLVSSKFSFVLSRFFSRVVKISARVVHSRSRYPLCRPFSRGFWLIGHLYFTCIKCVERRIRPFLEEDNSCYTHNVRGASCIGHLVCAIPCQLKCGCTKQCAFVSYRETSLRGRIMSCPHSVKTVSA